MSMTAAARQLLNSVKHGLSSLNAIVCICICIVVDEVHIHPYIPKPYQPPLILLVPD